MDYGKDNYTTAAAVQTYLDRTLDANENSILVYVIPAASRWIDRALGTNFDNNVVPKTLHFAGGHREINIRGCQNITAVQSLNPYDFSVWYTYSTPLEYTAEPYDTPVKKSLRMKANEFTGGGLEWPGKGDPDDIAVTGQFTEYDFVNNCYPNDIVLLCNHIAGVWLQNNQNADPVQRESIEGHNVMKRIDDLLASDPMYQRVLDSRSEVWLEEM